MKKADCTAEEWATHKAYARQWYQRNREKVLFRVSAANATPEQKEQRRLRQRQYFALPHVAAKRKLVDARPEVVARRKAYAQSKTAKARAKDRMEERYNTTPGLRSYRNNYGRLLRTGFTFELVEKVCAAQGNACAVCRRPFSETNKFHADHCHTSSTPRGLLCFQCNIIEGKLITIGLSPVEFGHRLQKYLENPPAANL